MADLMVKAGKRGRRQQRNDVTQYGAERCNGCGNLKRSRPWRGEVAMRCMNPKNKRRHGWVLDVTPEEFAGKVPVYTPVWCAGRGE